jgi:hypothetical protein
MALLAQIERVGRVSNARSANRRKLSLAAQGSTAAQLFATVVIHDLSETGVLIETNVNLATGERLEIDIPETGAAAAAVVWSSGRYFGCQFDRRLSTAAVSAALLRSAAPTRAPEAEMLVAAVAAPSEAAQPDGEPGKLPVAARMWALVALGVASWALVALIVWAAVAAGAIA